MQRLTTDQKETIAGGLIMALGLAFLFYLQSTNTPPVIDANSIDYQTYQEVSYELKGNWAKYAEGVYNRKYNGQ